MSPWYEVYDNAQMQLLTRNQAAKMTFRAAVAGAFVVACLSLGLSGSIPLLVAIALSAGALLLFGWWCGGRLRRLRRLVWCVKLSEAEVVGYDYARRKVAIRWADAERIEIGDRGLTIVGPHPDLVEIAHLFPDFSALSHRVVLYADRNRVPIFVNGVPWQQLDVYDLFPFLSEDASAT